MLLIVKYSKRKQYNVMNIIYAKNSYQPQCILTRKQKHNHQSKLNQSKKFFKRTPEMKTITILIISLESK